MRWVFLGIFAAGLLCCASAWRESNLGGDNPSGDQWERRQGAPFGWIFGLMLIVIAVMLGACQAATTPSAAPATTEEPGFTRFCADHPHAATCP
jgi:hypothetical protein